MEKINIEKKLKIDFGSGYSPKVGYKTCDITYAPNLDFVYDREKNQIIDCQENSVETFHLRNVIHHLPNLKETFQCLKKYLKKGGTIEIIDARKEYYLQNVILDILWYRYVTPRYDIWFSREYRNYAIILKQLNFKRVAYTIENEKEVSIWRKL